MLKKNILLIIYILFILLFIGSLKLNASSRFNKAKAEKYFDEKEVIELVKAAENGNIKKINEALSNGANINAISKDNNGEFTPLIWAFSKLNKKGYEYLLKKGADPNYHDKKGKSLMSYVASYKDPYYLELALNYGGDPNALAPGKNNRTIIFLAILYFKIENVMFLIKANADLNYIDNQGYTPMTYACIYGNYDIVYLLLEAGADPLLKNVGSFTIIWFIEEKNINPKHPVYKWYIKVVELLRSRGITVNVDLKY